MTPFRDALLATSGLVGAWSLDEGVGPTFVDSAGEAHGDDAGHECAPGQPSILPNDEGSSALFDGSGSTIWLPPSSALHLGDSFSLAAWVRSDAIGNDQYILDLGYGSCNIEIAADGRFALGKPGIQTFRYSVPTLAAGESYFLVATKDGGDTHLYINGVEVDDTGGNQTCESSESSKAIGSYWELNVNFFEGRLQYAAAVDRPLSSEEVAGLYAAAQPAPTAQIYTGSKWEPAPFPEGTQVWSGSEWVAI